MILGLTGQSGAGKTTVAQIFAEKGFFIVDTDLISRDVVKTLLPSLVKTFGKDIVSADGSLNRKKLAEKAFSSADKTKKLNNIMHPEIMAQAQKLIGKEKLAGIKNFIIDGAALFEAGGDKICDYVVVVVADKRTRRKRIMQRDAVTRDVADARFARQKSREFFRRHADFIIENDDFDTLDGKVVDIIKQINERK